MARKLNLVTPDIGAPDADRPDGYYLDEDTGVPGSPSLAGEANSRYYFFARMLLETGRTPNGNADNITVNQAFDSMAELISGRDPDVSAWSSGTYNQNDTVIHKGLQWFPGVASTINTPGINSQWCMSRTLREYMNEAVNLGPMLGGVIPLDDIRHADYAVYYREAFLEWYGDKIEAWTLHIDGSAHTSGTSDVAKLIAESKWGPLVTESDGGGILTLKDFTGLSVRAVDALLSENVGDRQESAMWGHLHFNGIGFGGGVDDPWVYDRTTIDLPGNAEERVTTNQDSLVQTQGLTSVPKIDGVNDAPNTANESRSANIAKGVWKLTILVPSGTI